MAFDLKQNNLSGNPSVGLSPSGEKATSYNFIDPYTYAMQYQPDLMTKLYERYGRGKITGFLRMVGQESTFTGDEVKHAEQGRLETIYEGVTESTGTYTTAAAHAIRVKDVLKVSDGTNDYQLYVTAVPSSTTFEAKNAATGSVSLTGDITVSVITNSFGKGEKNFTEGKTWNPEFYSNYPHIIKEFHEVAGSDLAHISWVQTPQGDRWFNYDTSKTLDLFDNKREYTHILHRRVAAGSDAANAGAALGMKGIVQQVEERGNIANDYIQTIQDWSNLAYRLKQQGQCREYTVWADHAQIAHFRTALGGVNAHYAAGANYGTFKNNKDMALALDFSSVLIDGVTFHITPWSIMDNPTSAMGASNLKDRSLGALIVPSGGKYATEDGDRKLMPYISIRHKAYKGIDRRRNIEFTGSPIGQPHDNGLDTVRMHCKTEETNQVIGANEYVAVRKSGTYYP